MGSSYRSTGYTIPPHNVEDFDMTREVNRCKNDGCTRQWVPDSKGILRCPRDERGNRLCGLKLAKDVPLTPFEESLLDRPRRLPVFELRDEPRRKVAT